MVGKREGNKIDVEFAKKKAKKLNYSIMIQASKRKRIHMWPIKAYGSYNPPEVTGLPLGLGQMSSAVRFLLQ
jgi:hypothetical protein